MDGPSGTLIHSAILLMAEGDELVGNLLKHLARIMQARGEINNFELFATGRDLLEFYRSLPKAQRDRCVITTANQFEGRITGEKLVHSILAIDPDARIIVVSGSPVNWADAGFTKTPRVFIKPVKVNDLRKAILEALGAEVSRQAIAAE